MEKSKNKDMKNIMSKKIVLYAAALLAFSSCASNDYVGDESLAKANNNTPISFDFDVPTPTRAGGTADDAAKLNNQFIVYAEKNENGGAAPATGNLVFPNYQVNYASSSANSTTSNDCNWDYVSYAHSANYQSNITTKDGNNTVASAFSVAQTIKYWDQGATNYVFTAVSALPADIENGRVKIQKNTSGTTKYDKGYTITLAKVDDTYPDLSKIYFADRIEKTKTVNTPYAAPVVFNFRNSLSQVRAGIYETVPGYAVSKVTFYKNDNNSAGTAFCAKVPNISASNFTGTLNVTYNDNNSGIENHPNITTSVTGTANTDLILGSNMSGLSTTSLMGTTSAAPTWDTAEGAYTSVSPQTNNTSDMTLKLDYTLYNSVTGEITNITGKTVTVPAKYAQWKPNYKYTYLFKITDSDLSPITFDAVVVNADDGTQETITTVDNPSITTYAKASAVTTNNEYKAGSNIYVVVNNGSVALASDKIKLYTATVETGAVQEITESTVANALVNGTQDPAGTWTVTDAKGKKLTVTAADGLTAFTEIPADDAPNGVAITINGAKFTPSAAGYYVFEYIDTSSNKHYKVIKVVANS